MQTKNRFLGHQVNELDTKTIIGGPLKGGRTAKVGSPINYATPSMTAEGGAFFPRRKRRRFLGVLCWELIVVLAIGLLTVFL